MLDNGQGAGLCFSCQILNYLKFILGVMVLKRMLLTVIMTLVIMGLMGGAVYAEEPATAEYELSLNRAIELAVNHSKSLNRAKLEVDRTKELRTYRGDQLDYVPHVPVGNPMEIAWAGYLTADLTWQMSKKALSLEQDSLVLGVCDKYWGVLKAKDNIYAKTMALKKAEWDARRAQVSKQVGMIAPISLSQAEAQMARAKAGLVTAENDLADAYAKLNDLLGFRPSARPVLVDNVEFHPLELEPEHLDGAIQRVIESSPAIWMAQEKVTLQKYLEDLMFYTGEYRPYKARKVEVEQAELDALSANEALRLATRNLYHSLVSLEKAYGPLVEAVDIAEENLRIVKLQYDLGMATRADLAAAEATLAETEQQALALQCQHAYLKLAFQKPWALGGM